MARKCWKVDSAISNSVYVYCVVSYLYSDVVALLNYVKSRLNRLCTILE